MPAESHAPSRGLVPHRLSWGDFDNLACGDGGADVVRRLRRAERSRRLLLLRALVDEVTKYSELSGSLPSPELAWDLLVRVQERTPAALDFILAHPYTGTWAGYTTRLLRNRTAGVGPLWAHVGYLHALSAAAAIRARLPFRTQVPAWYGGVMLPTLGLARLDTAASWSVADVQGDGHHAEIGNGRSSVRVPYGCTTDHPRWWAIRRLSMRSGQKTLSIRLDDLDPYRGLYEPVPPQRLDVADVRDWRQLLGESWQLITHCLPDLADAMPAGLDSLVPRPAIPFRLPSASIGEAFGSAIVALAPDVASLAATLVHEFQHIRLSGLLHLIPLHDDDPRERFYTGWRDDPRPIGGVLHGVYAFFGVTAYWRALAQVATKRLTRVAAFEFALWRAEAWRALCALRDDPSLTSAGRRFLDGVAERLGPWQGEPVPAEPAAAAAAVAADHYLGWRLRYLRPDPASVATLTSAWLADRGRPACLELPADRSPTPVPDGSWSRARADLARLRIAQPWHAMTETWSTVPDATAADLAYVTGRFVDAARGYRTELATTPDRPASWAGLTLALSAHATSPAARTLLRCPELVRAVHRKIRARTADPPLPDVLAEWIGRSTR